MKTCENCTYYKVPSFLLFYDSEEVDRMRAEQMSDEDIQHKCEQEHEVGECHRFPPSVKPEGNNYGYTRIEVFTDDWCGEFQNRKVKNDYAGAKRAEKEVPGQQ